MASIENLAWCGAAMHGGRRVAAARGGWGWLVPPRSARALGNSPPPRAAGDETSARALAGAAGDQDTWAGTPQQLRRAYAIAPPSMAEQQQCSWLRLCRRHLGAPASPHMVLRGDL
ncbi:hypothetical protein PSPO01_10411 [Paraphaeosphaeria sporulosa]